MKQHVTASRRGRTGLHTKPCSIPQARERRCCYESSLESAQVQYHCKLLQEPGRGRRHTPEARGAMWAGWPLLSSDPGSRFRAARQHDIGAGQRSRRGIRGKRIGGSEQEWGAAGAHQICSAARAGCRR